MIAAAPADRTHPMDDEAALVAVVEDDQLVQRALLRLLRRAGYRVEAFSSVEAYFDRFAWELPSCLVLDLHLPGAGGLELLERLREQQQEVPAVVITAHGSVPTTVRAMKAGACEFLEKPFDNPQLLAAVAEGARRGEGRRRDTAERAELRGRLAQLTPRERQVLDLVVEGLPNKKIAGRFQIAEKTIKVHRARVMEKMGAGSLAELVRIYAAADTAAGCRMPREGRPGGRFLPSAPGGGPAARPQQGDPGAGLLPFSSPARRRRAAAAGRGAARRARELESSDPARRPGGSPPRPSTLAAEAARRKPAGPRPAAARGHLLPAGRLPAGLRAVHPQPQERAGRAATRAPPPTRSTTSASSTTCWGDWQRALELYQRGLEMRRRGNDRKGMAVAYNNLGNVAYAAQRYGEALDYYLQSQGLYRGDRRGALRLQLAQQRRAWCTSRWASSPERAKASRRASRSPASARTAPASPARRTTSACSTKKPAITRPPAAAFGRAIAVRRELGDLQGLALSLTNLASVLVKEKDPPAAGRHLAEALELSRQLAIPELERDVLELRSRQRAAQNDWKGALADAQDAKELQEKIFTEKSGRQLAATRALFELEKKDHEIDALKQEKPSSGPPRLGPRRRQPAAAVDRGAAARRNRLQEQARRETEQKNRAREETQKVSDEAARAELAHLARVAGLGEMTAGGRPRAEPAAGGDHHQLANRRLACSSTARPTSTRRRFTGLVMIAASELGDRRGHLAAATARCAWLARNARAAARPVRLALLQPVRRRRSTAIDSSSRLAQGQPGAPPSPDLVARRRGIFR